MASGLVRTWAEQQFFDDLEKATEGLKSVVQGIVDANQAAKKAEGFAGQAASIKEVISSQNALVDANGKLINNYTVLNGKYKEAMSLIASENGHSLETVKVQREIIKLQKDEITLS